MNLLISGCYWVPSTLQAMKDMLAGLEQMYLTLKESGAENTPCLPHLSCPNLSNVFSWNAIVFLSLSLLDSFDFPLPTWPLYHIRWIGFVGLCKRWCICRSVWTFLQRGWERRKTVAKIFRSAEKLTYDLVKEDEVICRCGKPTDILQRYDSYNVCAKI